MPVLMPVLMRSAWVLAARGAAGVLFGLFALTLPGVTLLSLITVFAVYALLAGAVSVAGAVRARDSAADWWVLLLLGLASLVAGVLAALHPALTALVLVVVIGVNAVLTGLFDLMLALRLRRVMRGEWLLMLSGVTAIAFGLLILAYPGAGALALVWLTGVYALLTGMLYLALAYRARRKRQTLQPRRPAGRPRLERRAGDRRMGSAGH